MPEMQQRESLLSRVITSSSTDAQADPHKPGALPPWVHINDGNEEQEGLLRAPDHVRPNTRHYKPPPQHYKPGRKWDSLRTDEPPLLSGAIADHQQRWRPFMQSGPDPQTREGRVADEAWMKENMPGLEADWHSDLEREAGPQFLSAKGLMYKGQWLISPERQERTVRFFWRLLLKNAFVPLGFRLTVFAFSAAALGLAASLYMKIQQVNDDSDPDNQCASRASTYMAICVGSVALPYTGYVTWDEYMSKPLGLRSVAAKILLLLCDLYFVVFAASNLSLAFDALYDHRWACYDEQLRVVGDQHVNVQATCPDNPGICNKQKALSGVLFVSLVAWCTTFSLSVLRVVEKLRPD